MSIVTLSIVAVPSRRPLRWRELLRKRRGLAAKPPVLNGACTEMSGGPALTLAARPKHGRSTAPIEAPVGHRAARRASGHP
jgi:hypothetical protein